MPIAAGALITQNIRLVRLLGKGGMGSVWVADHLTLRTQVAVKFISEEHGQNADVLDRFSREATSAAQIKSPHVVQVFDHGVFQGSPYIVMELLLGEDLAGRIERGPLALGEIAFILQQVGKALHQAHALGIVHRDIKPANVFLTTSGDELHVKLLDFGVAKMTRDPSFRTTQTGQLVGTPCYMSPEQVFSRGAVDQRADLWALAVLTYEAVTGELPFLGNTLGDIYLAINSGVHRPPSKIERAFPSALDAWFKRAFSADPALRFASVREQVDAFAAVASRAPALRRSISPPAVAAGLTNAEPTGPQATLGGTSSSGGRTRSTLGLAMIAGLFIGLVTVGGAGLFLFGRGQPPVAVASMPTVSAPLPSAEPPASGSASLPEPSPVVVTAVTAVPLASASAPSAQPTSAPSAPRALPSSSPRPAPVPSGKPRRRDHGF